MKRKVALALLCFSITSGVGFGAALDESYVDMVFDKFEEYTPEQKEKKVDEAKMVLANPDDPDGKMIDATYITIVKSKEGSIRKYNISKEELKKNTDALKEMDC